VPRPLASSGRTLILFPKLAEAQREERIAAGEEPRREYLELARRIQADILDYGSVATTRLRSVRWARRLGGPRIALALLGFVHRNEYEQIYATGEDVAIPLVPLLRLARVRRRLTVVVHHAGSRRKIWILRLLGHASYRSVIALCAEQRRILTEEIGIPAQRVALLRLWCDRRFFHGQPPDEAEPGGYMLSVGMESRDYPTLLEAARGLPYPLRVVATGWSRGSGFRVARGVEAGANITVEHAVPATRLRQLYAGCRVAVVPLQRVNYAAGVTAIVEAMSMGKPVVVSASPGIVDYVRDGVSGRLVPVGDALAMRRAIAELWEDREGAARMGAHNRAWVESEMSMDLFVERVARMLAAGSGYGD
jgi:glycosyltransferase involved in cell wall biosynthesis